MRSLAIIPLENLPLVREGDDVSALIDKAVGAKGEVLLEGDVLVITHKIVSKAEGRVVELEQVEPSARALDLAEKTGKDPRVVELILREAKTVLRQRPGLIIPQHRSGWICANGGIDFSNVPGERVALLPSDPDESALRVRQWFQDRRHVDLAVVISDSHGRPFRRGLVGVALGCAGIPALLSRIGRRDLFGYELQHTETALADQIASAALLVMGEADEGIPVVLIRGLCCPRGEGRARDLIRPDGEDLFR